MLLAVPAWATVAFGQSSGSAVETAEESQGRAATWRRPRIDKTQVPTSSPRHVTLSTEYSSTHAAQLSSKELFITHVYSEWWEALLTTQLSSTFALLRLLLVARGGPEQTP